MYIKWNSSNRFHAWMNQFFQSVNFIWNQLSMTKKCLVLTCEVDVVEIPFILGIQFPPGLFLRKWKLDDKIVPRNGLIFGVSYYVQNLQNSSLWKLSCDIKRKAKYSFSLKKHALVQTFAFCKHVRKQGIRCLQNFLICFYFKQTARLHVFERFPKFWKEPTHSNTVVNVPWFRIFVIFPD